MKNIVFGFLFALFPFVVMADDSLEEIEKTWLKAKIYQPNSWLSKNLKDFDTDKKFPIIVYFHGCTGISGDDIPWIKFLSENGYLIIVPDSFARSKRYQSCDPANRIRGSEKEAIQRENEVHYSLRKVKEIKYSDGNVFAMGHSQGAWALSQVSYPHINAKVFSSMRCVSFIETHSSVPVLRINYDNDHLNNIPISKCRENHTLESYEKLILPGNSHSTYFNVQFRENVVKFFEKHKNRVKSY